MLPMTATVPRSAAMGLSHNTSQTSGNGKHLTFLLGRAHRAAKPSEVLPVLAELHSEATPLRQKCAKMEHSAGINDEKTIEKLTEALAANGSARR
jgi:hypothetical protein